MRTDFRSGPWQLFAPLLALLSTPLAAQDFDVTGLPRPASAGPEFGTSVSAEAGQVAIGDPGANMVYVYRREGDSLVLEVEIPLPPPEFLPEGFTGNPRFGAAIDLSVGAYCLDLTTCPGHALIIGAPEIEVVDIWSRNNPPLFGDPEPIWEPVLTFVTGDVVQELIGDLFGEAVALSEDRIFIGAPGAVPDGEVFVFSRDGSELADILGLDGSVLAKGGPSARFGSAIAYRNGKLGIGAPQAAGSGLVQLYNALSGNLDPAGMAMGSSGDQFGTAVSIDGTMVAAGAPGAELGTGGTALFSFNNPDNRVALAPAPDLTNVGSSVALQGNLVIAGASKDGNPVAVLRDANNTSFEVRLDGDLVAGASRQVFLAAVRAQGQVNTALNGAVLFTDGME